MIQIQNGNSSISPLVRRLDDPVITSLLQTDFYKFTMGRYICDYEPDAQVTFALKNRSTGMRLADIIPIEAVREQLDYIRTLHMNETELAYLRGMNFYDQRMFPEDYLNFLRYLELPEYDLSVDKVTGQFNLRFIGKWSSVTYWEIYALKVINELYYRYFLHGQNLSRFEIECIRAEGINRMKESFEILKQCDAIWSDFGTRRTFGVDWHRMSIENAMEYFSKDCFRGTSDTKMAMDYGIMPIGTNAHELPMVEAALVGYEELGPFVESQQRIVHRWWDLFGEALSIALPDTWGSKFFFEKIVGSIDQFWTDWKGVRDDSGNTYTNGDYLIRGYEKRDVDVRGKMFIPSDGLAALKIRQLTEYFKGKINLSHGWGTMFTNNLGLTPISLVCKVVEVNNVGAVKISNNPRKAIGKPEDITKVMALVGYDSTFNEECVV